MKTYVALMCCTILAACTESVDLSSISKESTTTNRNAEALTIEPVGAFQWTKLSTTQPELSFSLSYPRSYVIDGTVFVKAGAYRERLFKLSDTKDKWDYISSGPIKDAFDNCTTRDNSENYLFSYGSKFYYYFFGTFKSMDVRTRIQEELKPFPGLWREGKMSFVIGAKGYVMGGKRLVNNEYQNVNDLWEYNFATDKWTYKGGAPGGNRNYGKTAVLDGKLYVGMGQWIIDSDLGYDWREDWLRINISDPSTYFTAAPFPPYVGYAALDEPLTVNNKIYLYDRHYILGTSKSHTLWEYNPATNKWSALQDTPMEPETSGGDNDAHEFFSIGNAIYMIKGDLKELWRYSSTSLVPTNP